MAIAVSAWFDMQTESRVRDIWWTLAEAGLARTLHDGPYRPHVTLAVYDAIDRREFTATLRARLSALEPFPVVFSGLGAFLNKPPTLFLGVTQSKRLRQIHLGVHELLAAVGSGPVAYHLPDSWNPHCSLALELPGAAFPRAVELLSTLALPFDGMVDRVGIIDTPAEVELEVLPLGAAQSPPNTAISRRPTSQAAADRERQTNEA